jgi:hypothetical protein
VLSNGIDWWFYLGTGEGDWQTRKFYSIDLNSQDIDSVCDRFLEFLSKDNVMSGTALESAKKIHQSRERSVRIRQTLPDAWKAIITEPNEILMNLLVEETERLCGFKPDEPTVRTFIAELTHKDAPEKSSTEKEGKAPKSEGVSEGIKAETSRRRHKTIDGITLELLRRPGGASPEEIVEVVSKEKPSRDKDVLLETTKRRLNLSPRGYLRAKHGVKIEKSENGRYFIK